MAIYLNGYGNSEENFKLALWDYYRSEQIVNQIIVIAKLYQKMGTIDLDTHTFPVALDYEYSYGNTWGANRGWGGRRSHEGSDIYARYGTPVLSASYGVIEACIDGTLDKIDLEFEDNAAVCVVLASEGYPVKYEKGKVITGLENFAGKEDYYCFHAGTKEKDGQIVTNGGRVLGVTAIGADLKEARAKAYEATKWVDFENKYMRSDIGKAIDEA